MKILDKNIKMFLGKAVSYYIQVRLNTFKYFSFL